MKVLKNNIITFSSYIVLKTMPEMNEWLFHNVGKQNYIHAFPSRRIVFFKEEDASAFVLRFGGHATWIGDEER
jgi:hypothetical protein